MTNQRDLDIDYLEAQEQIDAEWDEFMKEWMGERGQEQQVAIPPVESEQPSGGY